MTSIAQDAMTWLQLSMQLVLMPSETEQWGHYAGLGGTAATHPEGAKAAAPARDPSRKPGMNPRASRRRMGQRVAPTPHENSAGNFDTWT
jgi:hypothetical protein